MKLFNIMPVKEKFSNNEMNIVKLGEKGKGTKYSFVPFASDVVNYECNYEIGETKNGLPKIVPSDKATQGYIAFLSGINKYAHSTYGSVYILNEDVSKIKIISYGFGNYNVNGSWNEFLVVVTPSYPVRFRIKPSSDYNEELHFWLVFNNEENQVSKVKDCDLELFYESAGVLLPRLNDLRRKNVIIDLIDLV